MTTVCHEPAQDRALAFEINQKPNRLPVIVLLGSLPHPSWVRSPGASPSTATALAQRSN